MPVLDLLATGYPSLDHIVRSSRCAGPGETALVDGVIDETRATPGGCGANVAVGLRRLGFATGVALVLGDDAGGHAFRDGLAEAGVDVRNVTLLAGERSSHAYLFCSPDGELQNFYFPGAADAWRGDFVLTAGVKLNTKAYWELHFAGLTIGYEKEQQEWKLPFGKGLFPYSFREEIQNK